MYFASHRINKLSRTKIFFLSIESQYKLVSVMPDFLFLWFLLVLTSNPEDLASKGWVS